MSSSPYLQHRATFQPLEVPEKRGVHASLYILSWIFFSNITILFNKWLIDTAGFRYPILLTTWHLLFATLATQILARTTTLLNSRHTLRLNGRIYLRTILPIGILYSGSLICSNVVYLYLSVAFIQMLKAASPVVVLLTSWIWGVADPSFSTFLNVLVIVLGVGLASFGEIEFSWIGFLYQWGGIIFEAIRLVMVQVMLSADEMGMDPLVGLYYYAPVCTIMNFFVAMVVEFRYFQWQDVVETGFGMLFLNALIAFMLNVASVFLIGKTSGLVMTLTSIFKNILLVILSVVIWHTKITELQIIGYATALAGLLYYSIGKDQLVRLWYGTPTYPLEKRDLEDGREEPSNTWFRVAIFTLLGFFSVVLVVSFLQEQGYSGKDFLRLTTTWFGSS